MRTKEVRQAQRNLNPTAPARVAMALWSESYASQNGGSMDFWDTLTPGQQQTCTDIAERIKEAPMTEGGR